jgi:hypothetical protein
MVDSVRTDGLARSPYKQYRRITNGLVAIGLNFFDFDVEASAPIALLPIKDLDIGLG